MIAKVKKYLSEVAAEMRRVTWTTRRELAAATAVVVVMVVLSAVFIGVADLIFQKLIVSGRFSLMELLGGGG